MVATMRTPMGVTAAAKLLGHNAEYVRRLCRQGKLPHGRIGRMYVFDVDELKKAKQERVAARKQRKLPV